MLFLCLFLFFGFFTQSKDMFVFLYVPVDESGSKDEWVEG